MSGGGFFLLTVMVWLIPGLLVVLGLWFLWTAWRFSERAFGVMATVVDLNEEQIPARRPSEKPTVLHQPVFAYRAGDGSPQQAEAFALSSGFNLAVGDTVAIWVDPDVPEIARIQSQAIFAPGLILVGMGIVIGAGVHLLGG